MVVDVVKLDAVVAESGRNPVSNYQIQLERGY